MKLNDRASTDLVDSRKPWLVRVGLAVAFAALGLFGVHREDPDWPLIRVVSTALDRCQDFWTKQIDGYRRAKVVMFGGSIRTACGDGRLIAGPFYCPADERIYIDLDFLRPIRGDLGKAIVIGHEIGHHVQVIRGVKLMGRAVELHADCLAGVWIAAEKRAGPLDDSDLDSALAEVDAIGDDRMGLAETGTHGTSQQRHDAVALGLASGAFGACDLMRLP